MMIVLFGWWLGCVENPCSDGENMSNPRIQGEIQENDEGFVLTVVWDKGTEKGALLPDAYFASPLVECGYTGKSGEGCSEITGIKLVKSGQWDVTIRKEDWSKMKGNKVFVDIALPDRRNHITCDHPGMDDLYRLIVELDVDNDGKIKKSTFKQKRLAGAF